MNATRETTAAERLNARCEMFERTQTQGAHVTDDSREYFADLREVLANLADYENRITWDTTCRQCATVLDRSIAEYERRERAETALAAVRALAGKWAGEPTTIGRFLANSILKTIDEAFKETAPDLNSDGPDSRELEDGYAALAASQDADDEAFHAAMRGRRDEALHDEIPALYTAGQAIHMKGQPANVLGTVIGLAPNRTNGEPSYEIVIYGGDFHRREYPHYHTVLQRHIEAADAPHKPNSPLEAP